MNSSFKNFGAIALAVSLASGPAWSAMDAPNSRLKKKPSTPTSSASKPSSWVLSGFLADQPTKRVYVTVEGRKILKIDTKRPLGLPLIATRDFIFPGLIDLHGHVKYNVLPLWGKAKGQFLNRYEWRKWAQYKNAVSFNMKKVTGDTVCAAVRWAELKALTGGATVVQGIGNDKKCAQDFGVHNIEIAGEFGNEIGARSMTDMVMPNMLQPVFLTLIAPKIPGAQIYSAEAYDRAYDTMLKETGVTEWVNRFASGPQTAETGLELLVGEGIAQELVGILGGEFSKELKADDLKDLEETYVAKMKDENARLLVAAALLGRKASEVQSIKAGEVAKLGKDIDEQVTNMQAFIFGDETIKGFLEDSARTKEKAFNLIGKGANLVVPSPVKRYINMFEEGVRQSAFGTYKNPSALPIIAHLAEGRRTDDKYNKSEFDFARRFDLVQKGLVIIHGVGLSEKEFAEAAKDDVSIVWSPFSNLLLYGETLDVLAAKSKNVNIAIGSDWTPTGSKSILDELKLAKRYLHGKLSDKEIVDLATVNAAKAVRLEKVIGKVAEGYQADILVFNNPFVSTKKSVTSEEVYSALLKSSQKDVALVVVNGQPVYGDPKLITLAAKKLGDSQAPELLPLKRASTTKACSGVSKAVRYPFVSKYDTDKAVALGLKSVAGLDKELLGKFEEYRKAIVADKNKKLKQNLVHVDPIYDCEEEAMIADVKNLVDDSTYQYKAETYASRVAKFIEVEIAENARDRTDLRKAANLSDDFSPIGDPASDDDEHI